MYGISAVTKVSLQLSICMLINNQYSLGVTDILIISLSNSDSHNSPFNPQA